MTSWLEEDIEPARRISFGSYVRDPTPTPNEIQLNLSPVAGMSHDAMPRDKNAVPVPPVKGRPHVTIVGIRRIISIGVTHRESKSDSDRYAGVRTLRRSKSECPCHQCN